MVSEMQEKHFIRKRQSSPKLNVKLMFLREPQRSITLLHVDRKVLN